MDSCYFCGRTDWIEYHHVFGGANRKKSTKYGFIVPLCHWCHNEPGGVHHNREKSLILKREAQRKFEKTHSREEFMEIFGKSYIMEDEE